ncbi:hypothetical protein TorRG33x02_099990 [Trema orientale]|uniref:DUF1985 domain-containing protein n=1 Tax=Trema orientale TaxID=63057 RepID=A0A2P5F8Z5_TREOI|nr:hypothetical protein TorRG33x02_099990 [Trema orientale]
MRNLKSKFLVPVEHHFPGRITVKGTTIISKIKKKFNKYGLMERANEYPFKQFFVVSLMQASRVLLHHLLLRMVKSTKPTELQFFIGDKNLRFGLREFALITTLNFRKDPDIVKLKSISDSTRLREIYLNNGATVRSGKLEAAFSKL